MKAILEFTLPEEKEDLDSALKANSVKIALEDINEIFRKRIKYGNYSEEVETILYEMQQEYFNIIEGIDL